MNMNTKDGLKRFVTTLLNTGWIEKKDGNGNSILFNTTSRKELFEVNWDKNTIKRHYYS